MKREKAYSILREMVSDSGLLAHCLAVAIVMEAIAMQTKSSKDKFWIAGLLHDADWQKYPEKHPTVIVETLNELGEEDVAYAISAHGTTWGVEYRSVLDRSLVAVDELTGLICAVAKVRPNGLVGMSVKSVMKKFRNRAFAKGVDRDEINRAVAILGVSLDELTKFIIAVLQCNAEQLGFPANQDLVYVPNLNIPEHSEMILVSNAQISHGRKEQVSSADTQSKVSIQTRKRSEQETIRLEKRSALIEEGVNPYPATSVEITKTAASIANGEVEVDALVKIAGRIMIVRQQGKAVFADLQDESGMVQLYFNFGKGGSLSAEKAAFFRKYIDRGDIIAVTGKVFTTRTGVPTVMATNVELLTKAIRPLPAVKRSKSDLGKVQTHDAFTNPELKYRQRYADLAVNPEVRQVFRNRTKIVDVLRSTFNEYGFLEMQTPILQPIYGGATARPFTTHHNALDEKFYLRIANELYLKRLIVGGFERVYEFSVDFRNEGMSRFHNPEFLQVEAYAAFKNYEWMMDFVEELVERVALSIHGSTQVETFGTLVDFKRPWKRTTMRDAIMSKLSIDIAVLDEDGLRTAAATAGIEVENSIVGKGKLIDEIFSAAVEPELIQPTFITEYPVELSPLAKRMENDPSLTERFEGFVCGKEFCNAFSELNDPVDQRSRFEEQLNLSRRGDEEAMMMDEDFLRALEYGMPPTAGLGLGIDRLTMIMLDQTSIQDVILFPQMRKEK